MMWYRSLLLEETDILGSFSVADVGSFPEQRLVIEPTDIFEGSTVLFGPLPVPDQMSSKSYVLGPNCGYD